MREAWKPRAADALCPPSECWVACLPVSPRQQGSGEAGVSACAPVCVRVRGQHTRTEARRSQRFAPGPGQRWRRTADTSGLPALPALLPVPTVVFYLQQGLFSESGLKWLCLSSLLLCELKTKPKKRKKKPKPKTENPTTINTKTLTHQTLAACVNHKLHQYSVKKLILLKTIHSTRD